MIFYALKKGFIFAVFKLFDHLLLLRSGVILVTHTVFTVKQRYHDQREKIRTNNQIKPNEHTCTYRLYFLCSSDTFFIEDERCATAILPISCLR